jgi:hypothetical protein
VIRAEAIATLSASPRKIFLRARDNDNIVKFTRRTDFSIALCDRFLRRFRG